MSTWILVITLTGGYYGTSPAIATLPGFASQQACVAAGNGYLASLPGHPYATTHCVEVRAKS